VDDRIFLWVFVAEVPDEQPSIVGVVEQFDDLLRQPSSSKSMPAPPALPRRPPTLRKVSISSRRKGSCACGGEVVGRLPCAVGDARREQAVGDGLRVHVGEAVGVEVVDQRSSGTPSSAW
jgi:hypothetical protein